MKNKWLFPLSLGSAFFIAVPMDGAEIMNKTLDTPSSLNGLMQPASGCGGLVTLPDGSKVLEVKSPETGLPESSIRFHLSGKDVKNKKVTISAEMKMETPSSGYIFQIWGPVPKGKPVMWSCNDQVKQGKNEWKTYSLTYEFPEYTDYVAVTLGIEKERGKFQIRKIAVSAEDIPVVTDAAEIMNRNFTGAPEDLKGITMPEAAYAGMVTTEDGAKALEVRIPESSGEKESRIQFMLNGEQLRNRRVTVSAEMKIDLHSPADTGSGGLFQLWGPTPKGKPVMWHACRIGSGQKDWKTYELVYDFPDYTKFAVISLGVGNAKGKVQIRNVKVKSAELFLPLDKVANWGFRDEKADDKQGGWHDQGPEYDAAKFPVKSTSFAGVPFHIVDPELNDGKAIIAFRCPKLPEAPGEVELDFGRLPAEKRYLYLLHCAAWEETQGARAGTIILYGPAGKTMELPVIYGRDLQEWWGGRGAENAFPGVYITAQAGGGSAYVSRFEIPVEFGPVEKIKIRKEEGNVLWLLLAGTLSNTRYEFPAAQKLVMEENEIWKAIPQTVKQVPQRGTALDMSGLFPAHEVGEFGRVIVGRSGHFEFEKRPGIPLKFMSFSSGGEFLPLFIKDTDIKDHKDAEAFAEQVARNGYNMIRIWVNNLRVFSWEKLNAGELDPSYVDRHDYLMWQLKKRGIYVYLSVACETYGFDNCYPWGDDLRNKHDWSIYRNERDYRSWEECTEKVLTHVNPYTGMRWIDDPQIAAIDCNNELEFEFLRADDRYAPMFRDYLKKKYGTFAALKEAWKKDAANLNSFEDIKTFHPLGNDAPGQLNRDRAYFINELEKNLYARERAFIRKLGYPGPVTTFLALPSMRQAGVRKDFDMISKNGYHDHPSGKDWVEKVTQNSSVGVAGNVVRTFLAARLYGKPYLVSEHSHCYPNRYRYEHGFVMGGYSALNNFDMLTAFGTPVTTLHSNKIVGFDMRFDPVRRATELINVLLFRRNDVRGGNFTTRVRLNEEEVIQSDEVTASVNSRQLCLGLLGEFALDQTELPVRKNEYVMNRAGGASTAVRRADISVVDGGRDGFDLAKTVADLRERGFLPQGNRTDVTKDIFESGTGELYLEAESKRMEVRTPRFQGLCTEAGGSASFPNFEVLKTNRNGCFALASIDDSKDLGSAERLLLFAVTNALNSGSIFENADQRVKLVNGDVPILVESGEFEFKIRTPLASTLKAWALRFDGTRAEELPLVRNGNEIRLKLDTSKLASPTFYVEFSKQ